MNRWQEDKSSCDDKIYHAKLFKFNKFKFMLKSTFSNYLSISQENGGEFYAIDERYFAVI